MYCDFYSVADKEELIPAFVDALILEISQSPYRNTGWDIDTVFFGGGTPTILGKHQLDQVLNALHKHLDLSNVTEFTIETNPGELKKELLISLPGMGVNRLSIGIQSLHQKHLDLLTRIHTAGQAIDTIKQVQDSGLSNINTDLIFGIPNQTTDEWELDLRTILAMGVQHVSAYSLTVEDNTGLHKGVEAGMITMPEDDISLDMFYRTRQILKNDGYIPYEISNFSLPGYECKHNLHYWCIHPYLAFGPSAHGFDGITRWNNLSSVHEYIRRMKDGGSSVETSYEMDDVEYVNQVTGFGLRLSDGFSVNDLPSKYHEIVMRNVKCVMGEYPGCLEISGGRIRLTETGLAFADGIAAEMAMP